MAKVRIMKKLSSPKTVRKNSTFRARDFRYPLERTTSGTLYTRLPSGQMIRVKDEDA